jgi:hypothetical protein
MASSRRKLAEESAAVLLTKVNELGAASDDAGELVKLAEVYATVVGAMPPDPVKAAMY